MSCGDGAFDFQDYSYAYTPTGDITAIRDNLDGQSQCFRYDAQHRLTEAFTATDTCAAAPGPRNTAHSGRPHRWTPPPPH